MIASELSSALNLIIPREVNPDIFATLTVGLIKSGTASNIIPGTAEMAISIRTLDPDVYDYLLKRVPEVANGYITAWRGKYTLKIHKTPGTVCNAALSAEMSKCVPSFFGFLGAGGADYYPLHNSRTIIDENVLPYGAAILANCAVEWLNSHK